MGGTREPSALGILIYPFLFYSALFVVSTFAFKVPAYSLICIIPWIVFFSSIMFYDRSNWGRPRPDTLGIWMSSQTRNLNIGEYAIGGMVLGSCVKARNIFTAARAESRSLVGGEAVQFTSLVEECRNIAMNRMCEYARSMGCNGIIGFRIITTETLWGATEIIAYGTAVRVRGLAQ